MSKTERVEQRCSACGYTSPKWFGRCPECGGWSTAGTVEAGSGTTVVTLAAPGDAGRRLGTGLDEMDRVLGGGLVRGSVVLLAGEPGIGKSTLMLQLVAGIIGRSGRCLVATGEESLSQVAGRALRLGLDPGAVRAVATTSLPDVVAAMASERPDVLVVDSVQTIEDPALDHLAGSPTQVRHCATTLVGHAKRSGCCVVLVGHVTKEGTVAGPKVLEHIVDIVLALDGERTGTLRLLRASKNRFGACDETGVFSMTAMGLEAVPDPSEMFLADRREGIAGSAVFPLLQGSRPVLVEIQALVSRAASPAQARRVTIGVDGRRVAMILGVLTKNGLLSTADADVFVVAAGGLTVVEPAADLAIAMAVVSGATGEPLPPNSIAIGEIGLGGEIRRVPGTERRSAEAARLGFSHALVPSAPHDNDVGLLLHEVRDVQDAIERARGAATAARSLC
ncbi:MAG TPA: DNA repair protein RadA [Actinomycetota bacterium]|nr:DNA repair protein RadA [Actinomycetota bacterium]